MDLKFKGKSWAGNIYHQFESMCQDVDDFMNKDTVKFVENQVQNVGVNFKRFYSNVVQDILPLSGESVKSGSQLVECERVDTQGHVNSVADITAEPICVNENHLSANQSSIDTTRNSDPPLPTKNDHGMQITGVSFADLSQEGERHLHFREDGDDIVFNDDHTKGSMLLTTESSSMKDISSEISNEDYKISIPTMDSLPVPSIHETGTSDGHHKDSALNVNSSPATIEKKTISCNSYSDDNACPSNVSINNCGFGSKLPIGDNPILDADKVLPGRSGTGADKDHECVTMDSPLTSSTDATDRTFSNSNENRSVSMPSVVLANKVNELDSLLPSTSDAADRSLGTDGILYDSFSTKDESFDASSSFQSSDPTFSFFSDEEEWMNGHLDNSSPTPKFSNFLKSRSANFTKNVEVVHHFHAKSAYNVSTPSEAKDVDMLPAFLISELNENNAFQNNTSKFVGSSESRHERQPRKGESKLVISSSEIGIVHDLNMETIDLSSNSKPDEESFVLNTIFARSTSHRTKNFQYYKKLIQDAFTSRKRLSKEYKHLPILYGDMDKESSQHFQPSSATGILMSSQETCESEWELL